MKKNFHKVSLLLCFAAFMSCETAQQERREAEYSVITVSSSNHEIRSAYSSIIRGKQDIDIYPQVSGFISHVSVNEGDIVRKGQTLFIIDQVPYKAALLTANANVEAAKASVSTANLTYNSKKTLFEKNVISEFELQTSYNNLLLTKAQLAQAEAQQVNAENNLSYTVVKSPSEGVVGTIPFRVGALVGASSPKPLTTVSDNSKMYVYFSMNETQLLSLTRSYGSMHKAIESMPAVKLQLSDGSIYESDGHIETISGVIDQSTGSVSLRAVFPNEGRLLHSGGTGNVIIADQHTDCIVIPQIATFEIQDKVYVYKVNNGTAESSLIEVSKINNGKEFMVKKGLSNGDVILTEGVGIVREGTPVKPRNN